MEFEMVSFVVFFPEASYQSSFWTMWRKNIPNKNRLFSIRLYWIQLALTTNLTMANWLNTRLVYYKMFDIHLNIQALMPPASGSELTFMAVLRSKRKKDAQIKSHDRLSADDAMGPEACRWLLDAHVSV